MPLSPRRRRMVRLGVLAVLASLLAGALLYIGLVPPTDSSILPKCALHSFTGLHCPGCGLTRSLHALLNGQLSQAVAYHTFSILVLPFLGVSVARSLWEWAWGEPDRRPRRRERRWVTVTFVVLLLTFSVARNIPVYPLTLLAPHELTPAGEPAP